MLSNTFIVSEIVVILYSFPTWSCVKMCHTAPRPVPHTWKCVMVPRPVSRTWQCVVWYHNQCISHGNVSYGNTTSASHLAMCHTVPWLVQHDNATYGNTTCVFHMAICHTVPRPVSFTWQCVIRYHDQRLSHGTKVESLTSSSDEVYFFSVLGTLCDTAFERRH